MQVIYEMEQVRRLTVQCQVTCERPVQVHILYGLTFGAVKRLYALRYDGNTVRVDGSPTHQPPSGTHVSCSAMD